MAEEKKNQEMLDEELDNVSGGIMSMDAVLSGKASGSGCIINTGINIAPDIHIGTMTNASEVMKELEQKLAPSMNGIATIPNLPKKK